MKEMDLRLKRLSYSSLLKLHQCPRSYELYKLGTESAELEDPNSQSQITFAFGHAVGEGVALAMLGESEDEIIWKLFLSWEPDLLADDPKRNKSFWLSVVAVQKLIAMRREGFLSDWEIVTYQDKPAIELSFAVNFPDGFVYVGYVDAVLRNKADGRVMVLECKTSSAYDLPSSMYKNSAQAIGYSIVLDAIFPSLSTYEVQYLIYRTKHMLFEPMKFTKSFLQRALWIQELLLDIETLKLYSDSSVFPMRGESCRQFGRDCEYFGICTMSNTHITTPMTNELAEKIAEDNSKFQIRVSINDLIEAQLAKSDS